MATFYAQYPPSAGGATNASVGTTGTTAPTSATEVGFIDSGSGNLAPFTGPIATGPNVTVASSALPAGSATAAKQDTGNTSLASIDTKTPALGQALAAASTPVVLTAAQISTLTPLTTVTVNQGTQGVGAWPVLAAQTGTWSNTVTQATGTNLHTVVDSGSITATQATGSNLHAVIDSGTITTVSAVTAISNALPAGSNVIGHVIVDTAPTTAVTQSGTWTVQPGNTPNTTPWLFKESVSSTATLSNVASSATSVTVLASNANRLGATFFNDSTQVLYLKFGATASNSSYTVQLAAGSYYELPTPHLYTGIIDGIWASANGNARVTELT